MIRIRHRNSDNNESEPLFFNSYKSVIWNVNVNFLQQNIVYIKSEMQIKATEEYSCSKLINR